MVIEDEVGGRVCEALGLRVLECDRICQFSERFTLVDESGRAWFAWYNPTCVPC